jgi:hypothetical protein
MLQEWKKRIAGNEMIPLRQRLSRLAMRSASSSSEPIIHRSRDAPAARLQSRAYSRSILKDFARQALRGDSPLVDFQAIHANRGRRLDAEADGLALNRRDRNANAAIDNDLLADTACQNQHGYLSLQTIAD